MALPWEEHDWRGLPPVEQERALADLRRADRERGFDLVSPPLIRLTLVRTGEEVHRLVWSVHHLILDGWSLRLVLREVFSAYAALSAGRLPDLGGVRPYRDFIHWLQRRDAKAMEPFWRQSLDGFSAPTPLVAERSMNGSGRRTYQERETRLTAATTAALAGFAKRHGLTLNNLVQGAWALLLARYSGEDDVVFGVTVSGRLAPVQGIESMVGLFINTLPLRVRVDPGAPLAVWLRGIQEMHGELLQHEHAPLVDVQGWSGVPRGQPLFESIVVFQNFPLERVIDPEMVRALPVRVQVDHGVEPLNYPLALVAFEGERLEMRLSYEVERIGTHLALRMLAHLRAVLEWMPGHPEARLGDLALLGETERHQLLCEWSATAGRWEDAGRCGAERGGEWLAHELFAAQAERTPEAVAAVHGSRTMTYGELDRRANRLARHLRAAGVRPEVAVGLCVERGFAMLVGLLGIFKAGGIHIPLDPTLPRERLAFLQEDSGAAVVLTQARLAPGLAAGPRMIRLDGDWAEVELQPPTPLPRAADPDNGAYATYTSGSTGRPKGVLISHRSLASFILGLIERLDLRGDDRVLQFSPLGFDLTLQEIFPMLLVGGRVVFRDPDELATSYRLLRALAEEGITTVELPTAFWNQWVFELERSGERLPGCLRWVITGTDKVLVERVQAWRKLGVPLVHAYGMTEVTVTSTLYTAAPRGGTEPAVGAGLLPVGQPFGEHRVYVLDEAMQPVPIGVPGEIFLAGSGLMRGYLHRLDLTAEKLIPSPWGEPGERMCRTGDLGRWQPDGNLEFLGRRDRQVKIRGFRIEPGEVEAALGALPGIRGVVVVARPYAPGDLRLVAYVVGEPDGTLDPRELKMLLASSLPPYMVPAHIVPLSDLPLTSNGKVDRAALPVPELAGLEAGEGWLAPRTPMEEILASIWSEVLGVERVGVYDNFFELGGHSLLATRVVSQVRSAFRVEIGLRELFEEPTVAGLAVRIEAALRAGTAGGAPPIERVSRDADLPLSFAQQRLWFIHQLDPGSPVHNMSMSLLLEGELDIAALEGALSEVVRRHEALRTRFPTAGALPVQRIEPPVRQALPVIDLRVLEPAAREEEARRLGREEAARPFDLARGPLLRGTLIRRESDVWSLLFGLHHIVGDGWSTGILVREISALYGALQAGEGAPGADLPELPIQYADYAAWQRAWFS
ncbi:MAG TPA: amino acid adenylation domain-containing protein, partial [Thermoanaerobaculia bacterium]|nr:amino acid adenylation domain-containing protein [Thermoanaerobaculia bacterium]